MKLYDINLDCLGSLLEDFPLEKRLLTLRQVNSQLKTAVEDICQTQTELTLQIGSGNQWEWMVKCLKHRKLLVNAMSPFHSLTAARLTDELTTFLISTFPRLKSLAIVVDDNMTETVDFLHNLPRLISAFSSTLTTLQLVLRVRDDTFEAIFRPLITSIDGLHQLKRLSFFDVVNYLEVPLFDLPHLLSTSLETLDFHVFGSPVELARHWEGGLQARQSNKASSKLMRINYMLNSRTITELPFSHLFPANVAVHFHSMFLRPQTVADLEHIGSGAFTNLRTLDLFIGMNVTFSVGNVLVQLARLPHLTDLILQADYLKKIDYPSNRPLPVLSAVRKLRLLLYSADSLHKQVNTEALRSCQVFPNLLTIAFSLISGRCKSCGWKGKVSADGHKFLLVKGSERLMEQCVTRLAMPFASDKNKPSVAVCFTEFGQPNLNYTVDFDDEGMVKQAKFICI